MGVGNYKKGFVLMGIGADDALAIEQAKDYCKTSGHTADQVEIIKTGGIVIVRVK